MNKARGKSGPLFSFDVHEDVRVISDASVEKDEVSYLSESGWMRVSLDYFFSVILSAFVVRDQSLSHRGLW